MMPTRDVASSARSAYKKVANTKKAPYILFKQSILTENLDACISGLKEIINKYPEFPLINAVRYVLTLKLYVKKDYEAAIFYLEEIENQEILGIYIFTPYVYTLLGLVNYDLHNYEQAIAYYNESNKMLSNHGSFQSDLPIVRNYLEISKTLLSLKDDKYSYIEDLLQRIFGTSSSSLYKQEALFILAQYYEDTGDALLAYSVYLQLIQDYPTALLSLEAKKRIDTMEAPEADGSFQFTGIYDESILDGTFELGKPPAEEERFEEEIGEIASHKFFIQVGSFTERKNAENLFRMLGEKGYSAIIIEATIDKKKVYRVRVGSFPTSQEAEKKMGVLLNSGYQGFIVKEK